VGGNQQDIEMGIANEVRVITKLCSNGGHRNIIAVLQHGWLNKDQKYYFDMELCEMNLDDFIKGSYIAALGNQYFDPTSAGGEGPECLNLWNIMRDITRGLEYIHGLREVHRDLKPQNGTSISSIANVVLLSPDTGAWKITDFGLTFEGTSRIKYTTRNSRGTQGYRAIELLRLGEQGYVTKASDVWALGCIFYELAYKTKAFSDDIEVWDYVYRTQKLKGVKPLDVNERTAATARELIRRTLEVDWWKRPTASDVLHLLDSLTNQPGLVFSIGEPESESDSTTSSIPVESLIESPSRSPALVKEDLEPIFSFVATPHLNQFPPRSVDPSPSPWAGAILFPFHC